MLYEISLHKVFMFNKSVLHFKSNQSSAKPPTKTAKMHPTLTVFYISEKFAWKVWDICVLNLMFCSFICWITNKHRYIKYNWKHNTDHIKYMFGIANLFRKLYVWTNYSAIKPVQFEADNVMWFQNGKIQCTDITIS